MSSTAMSTNGEGRFIAIVYAFRELFYRVSRSSKDMAQHVRAGIICLFSRTMNRTVSPLTSHLAYDTRSRCIAKCITAAVRRRKRTR
jgi:hypothetical protein